MGTMQLYVGIDVHKRDQVSSILPISIFESKTNEWKKIKPITVRNNIEDFESLHNIIVSHSDFRFLYSFLPHCLVKKVALLYNDSYDY